MSKANELWFKEPVTIFFRDGRKADGINVAFVRYLNDGETIDDVDLLEEFEDFMGGTTLGDLYEVVTFEDGSRGYVELELDDYSDYGSSCEYEFTTEPFDDGKIVDTPAFIRNRTY